MTKKCQKNKNQNQQKNSQYFPCILHVNLKKSDDDVNRKQDNEKKEEALLYQPICKIKIILLTNLPNEQRLFNEIPSYIKNQQGHLYFFKRTVIKKSFVFFSFVFVKN